MRVSWGPSLQHRAEVVQAPQYATSGKKCLHLWARVPENPKGNTYFGVRIKLPQPADLSAAEFAIDGAAPNPKVVRAFYLRAYDTSGHCAISFSNWASPFSPAPRAFTFIPAMSSGGFTWEWRMLEKGADASKISEIELIIGTSERGVEIEAFFDTLRIVRANLRRWADIKAPRPIKRYVEIARGGKPSAVIIAPPQFASQARELARRLQGKCGARLPVVQVPTIPELLAAQRLPAAAAPDWYRPHDLQPWLWGGAPPQLAGKPANAIYVGNVVTTSALSYFYSRMYTAADDFYPGPGGFEVRVIPDPWATGQGAIILGCSDVEGLRSAADALLAKIRASGQSAEVPVFFAQKLTSEAKRWYGSRFGRQPTERYIEGQKSYAERRLRTGAHTGLWGQIADIGEKYARTGYSAYAQLFCWLVDRAYRHYLTKPKTYGGPWGMDSDFMVYRVIPAWAIVELDSSLTDEQRWHTVQILYRWVSEVAVSPASRTVGSNRVRFNHQTFPALGLLFAADYFGRYFGILEAEQWQKIADECFLLQARSFKPHEDCNGYQWLSLGHLARYSLTRPDFSYFIPRPIRTAAAAGSSAASRAFSSGSTSAKGPSQAGGQAGGGEVGGAKPAAPASGRGARASGSAGKAQGAEGESGGPAEQQSADGSGRSGAPKAAGNPPQLAGILPESTQKLLGGPLPLGAWPKSAGGRLSSGTARRGGIWAYASNALRDAHLAILGTDPFGYATTYGDTGNFRGWSSDRQFLRLVNFVLRDPAVAWCIRQREKAANGYKDLWHFDVAVQPAASRPLVGALAFPLDELWWRSFGGPDVVPLEKAVDKVVMTTTISSSGRAAGTGSRVAASSAGQASGSGAPGATQNAQLAQGMRDGTAARPNRLAQASGGGGAGAAGRGYRLALATGGAAPGGVDGTAERTYRLAQVSGGDDAAAGGGRSGKAGAQSGTNATAGADPAPPSGADRPENWQYLLLDCLNVGGHRHWDGNSISRWCDRGRMWLHDADYFKAAPKYHSLAIVLRDGLAALPPSMARLDHIVDLPNFGFSETVMADYNGLDWHRLIFWAKGRWFIVADRFVARKAGRYSIRTLWQCIGQVRRIDGWRAGRRAVDAAQRQEGRAAERLGPRVILRQRGAVAQIAFDERARLVVSEDEEYGRNLDGYDFVRRKIVYPVQAVYEVELKEGQQFVAWALLEAREGEDADGFADLRRAGQAAVAVVRGGKVEAGAGVGCPLPASRGVRPAAWLFDGRRAMLVDWRGRDWEVELASGRAVTLSPAGRVPDPVQRVAQGTAGSLRMSAGRVRAALGRMAGRGRVTLAGAGQAAGRARIAWTLWPRPDSFALTGNEGLLGAVACLEGMSSNPPPLEKHPLSRTPGRNELENLLDGSYRTVSNGVAWEKGRRVEIVVRLDGEYAIDAVEVWAWWARRSSIGEKFQLRRVEAYLAPAADGPWRRIGEVVERGGHEDWGGKVQKPQIYRIEAGGQRARAVKVVAEPPADAYPYLAELVVRGKSEALAQPEELARRAVYLGRFTCVAALQGGRFAAGRRDGSVWLVEDGRGRKIADLGRAVTAIGAVRFQPGQPAIVVGTEDGLVVALQPDGKRLWEARLEYYKARPRVNVIIGADLAGDGRQAAIVGSDNWRYHAFDADGRKLWHYESVHKATAAVAVDLDGDGRQEVVMGTNYYWWPAARPDGSRFWHYSTRSGSPEATAVAAGDVDGDGRAEVIFGGADGSIQCVEHNGKPKWMVALGDRVAGLACADVNGDGRAEILAASANMNAYCLDGQGKVVWYRGLQSPAVAAAMADGRFVCACEDGSVWVLNSRDGAALAASIGAPCTVLAASDGQAAVADEIGRLVGISW